MQDATFQPGEVLLGKYRIERVLGEGGMGIVLLAQHLQLEERVAIKVPTRYALASPDAVARFLREAQSAVKIKSEFVARVNDVGVLDCGRPYMVMEFLEGADLSERLVLGGWFEIEQAVEFIIQACEALAEAHSLGIVHRDLKPANLFCTQRVDGLQVVKLLDFGISKVNSATATQANMTQTGTFIGSPLYMSPEQSHSAHSVDERADIWALGVILYELLCGKVPFSGDNLLDLASSIATDAPDPMSSMRPETPPQLEAVILRCLEKSREKRFQSVAELACALLPFAPERARSSVERSCRVLRLAQLARGAGAKTQASRVVPLQPTIAPRAAPGAVTTFSNVAVATESRRQGTPGMPEFRSPWRFKLTLVAMVGGLLLLAGGLSAFDTSAQTAPHTAAAIDLTSSALQHQPSSLADTPSPASNSPKAKTPTEHNDLEPMRGESAAQSPIVPNPAQVPASGRVARELTTTPPTQLVSRPSPVRKRSSCTPNYYFDEQGDKHFKPQCF